ncbi:MIP/aquaporin family protein [Caminibacter mediatlanticus]|uniref:MIP family channel protein n=1 Tax=Caminibacter mediatlanticus TB-2 TaxID=391592 RepID=A0AAI9AGW7_9BACT|nr:MIP family channel protein [Caminibacter mediatlanticus]EDM23412.1 MIP family channel protein [Caminibacter mediatlanticus TB-2]
MRKEYIAEFLGSYILVFSGCLAIVVDALFNNLGSIGVSLVFGLVIVALIYAFGHISGAHFNPAVTISFALMKEFDKKEAVKYIFAQISGAIFASFTIYLLVIEYNKSMSELKYLGSTLPSGSLIQSFILEFILTFILMIVIYTSAIHGKAIKSFAGIAIGFTVGIEAMIGGAISGASMNPARSIGPAIVSGNLDSLWLYIVASILGAIVAGVVFINFMKCKGSCE